MIREAIATLVSGHSLTTDEAKSVMEEIMEGTATHGQIAAFATALRLKGETVEEIVGLAKTMRDKAVHVKVEGPLVDTCGTGGDTADTFNISTATALVAAGAGLKVAKHGGRAVSSRSGSADVLEALGVKIELNAEQVQQCLNQIGIGFMFAPVFHPALKYAAPVRKEIGIRTVFNILGPLTNPAGAQAQVLGVAEKALADKMALVLKGLGCRRALVVHGEDGMDEITITGMTRACELKEDGHIEDYFISPEDFGMSRAQPESVKGGNAAENADLLRAIFNGEMGSRRDVVLMNAAAVLLVGGKAKTLKQGVALAAEAVDNGSVKAKLEQLIEFSRSFTGEA